MTEQYRDGSDDDFFSYLITAHCNEKNFFFIPLFLSLFFNTTAP